MLLLRSLLFYFGVLTALVVYAPFILGAVVLPLQPRFRVVTQWTRFSLWWLEITCHLRYRVTGRENIPPGPAIIMAKHQSAWETLVFQRIFPAHTWVLKRALLFIPIGGWGLAVLRAIAIDRAAGRKALQQVIEQGTQRLQSGLWVVIFPEGTRTAPGTRGKYNIGGAMLARKSGYPVVPVAHNAGEFWRRNSIIKHPGVIDVVIGPVIDTRGKDTAEINHLVETWIEGTMERISTLPASPGGLSSPPISP